RRRREHPHRLHGGAPRGARVPVRPRGPAPHVQVRRVLERRQLQAGRGRDAIPDAVLPAAPAPGGGELLVPQERPDAPAGLRRRHAVRHRPRAALGGLAEAQAPAPAQAPAEARARPGDARAPRPPARAGDAGPRRRGAPHAATPEARDAAPPLRPAGRRAQRVAAARGAVPAPDHRR
ncbi:hypothetical protein EG864_14965, partial [Enterococcus faecalis]